MDTNDDPDLPDIVRTLREAVSLRDAHQELVDLEARHRAELAAARTKLSHATRTIRDVPEMEHRLRIVEWAYHLPKVLKRDLSHAVFGDENKQWHLRKILASPYRKCDRCGCSVVSGHLFEVSVFYCDHCSDVVRIEQERDRRERDRRRESERLVYSSRIEQLKAKGHLTTAEANELAALHVSLTDGPAGRLVEYVGESLLGRNFTDPSDEKYSERGDIITRS